MNSTFFYPEGFKHIVPDSFLCRHRCTTCVFNIVKYNSHYIITAGRRRLRGCSCKTHPENQKLCFENWILSNRLKYNHLPIVVNNWINGYRNIIYIDKMRQKKDKFFSSKQLKTPEHTFTALDEGTNFASNLHQLLIQTDVFSRIEFELLSLYLSSHSLYNLSNYSMQDTENGFPLQQWQKAKKIKEIFDYLKQHVKIIDGENLDYIIDKFNSQYQHFVDE